MDKISLPTQSELQAAFYLKYGDPKDIGWSPAMRFRFGYHNPDDVHEAMMDKLINEDTSWLDLGCGRNIFPSNAQLARRLADRCQHLTGVDPDDTIKENSFVHEIFQGMLGEFETARLYDVISLRMVAEHVVDPTALVVDISKKIRPGGLIVIYTVNKYSPVPLITNLVPFSLHNPIKKILWRTEEKDTFPTAFKMNTRKDLREVMEENEFSEVAFEYLDDCRTLDRFKPLLWLELSMWKLFSSIGWKYPENCILGVYRKADAT